MTERHDRMLLLEVEDVLRDFAALRGALAVETDGARVTVTLTVPFHQEGHQEDQLDVLELYNRLAYLAGLGQIRAFAAQYGLDADALEPLLRPKEDR